MARMAKRLPRYREEPEGERDAAGVLRDPRRWGAATEAACCVLRLERQTLIPTWHLDKVLQPCALDAVRGAPRPTRVRYVLNNSAGFGGYNSSVVLAVA